MAKAKSGFGTIASVLTAFSFALVPVRAAELFTVDGTPIDNRISQSAWTGEQNVSKKDLKRRAKEAKDKEKQEEEEAKSKAKADKEKEKADKEKAQAKAPNLVAPVKPVQSTMQTAPVLLPDTALVSILKDVARTLKQPDAALKSDDANQKAVLAVAQQILEQALALPNIASDRIVRQEELSSDKLIAEAWASGEVALPDGARGSLAAVWAKRENGLVNITIAGDSDIKTPGGRPIGQFIVVVTGKSAIDKGFDIQSQSEVRFWICKLDNVAVESACGNSGTASGAEEFSKTKSELPVLPTVITERSRAYLAKLQAFRDQKMAMSNVETMAPQMEQNQQKSDKIATNDNSDEDFAIPRRSLTKAATGATSAPIADDLPLRGMIGSAEKRTSDSAEPSSIEQTQVVPAIGSTSRADKRSDESALNGSPNIVLEMKQNAEAPPPSVAMQDMSPTVAPLSVQAPVPTSAPEALTEAPAPTGPQTKPEPPAVVTAGACKVPLQLPSETQTEAPAPTVSETKSETPAPTVAESKPETAAPPAVPEAKPETAAPPAVPETKPETAAPPAVPETKSETTALSTAPENRRGALQAPAATTVSETKEPALTLTTAEPKEISPISAVSETKIEKLTPKAPVEKSPEPPVTLAEKARKLIADLSPPAPSTVETLKPAAEADKPSTAAEPAMKPAEQNPAVRPADQIQTVVKPAPQNNAAVKPVSQIPTASDAANIADSKTQPVSVASLTTQLHPANSSSGWESPALQESTKQPSLDASLMVPDRAIAGQFVTVGLTDADGNAEPLVELTFNGSPSPTDKSGRVTYMVAEDATPGRSLNIALGQRPELSPVVVDVRQTLSVQSDKEPPAIDKVTQMAGANRIVVIDGHNFDGDGEHDRVYIDGTLQAKVLSASPLQVKALLPDTVQPGARSVAVEVADVRSNAASLQYATTQVRADAKEAKKDQLTKLYVFVAGSTERKQLRITNQSPAVIKFIKGDNLHLTTSGGENNVATFGVERLHPGNYKILVRIE